MRSLILGLGNPLLGDDGIGCRCAEDIKLKLADIHGIEADQFFRGGISLMERLIGYDRVLIIDSFVGSGKTVGEVFFLTLDDLPSSTMNSPHDSSLKNAIEFGIQFGQHLPEQVDIIAVEIEPSFVFSESLSPEIENCIPRVRELATQWINRKINS